MPFVKTGNDMYRSPSGRKFTKKQVKAYYATNGFTKKKRVPIVTVNKKRKKGFFGETISDKNTGLPQKIKINIKDHYKKGKLDKSELASTVKHELMHVKHPKMTEKQVYKKTAKTKIPLHEQSKLLAKLRRKKLNYKVGSLKRKLKMKRSDKIEPGTLINRARAFKQGVQALI